MTGARGLSIHDRREKVKRRFGDPESDETFPASFVNYTEVCKVVVWRALRLDELVTSRTIGCMNCRRYGTCALVFKVAVAHLPIAWL